MNTRQVISPQLKTTEPKLLCVSFNQNQDCFAIGHENGFRVYSTDPMVLRVKRTFNKSEEHKKESRLGIGHISMLHRTNFLSLVGGGKNPKFPLNRVIIYDDLKKKNTLSLEFMSSILNVFLSRIRIIIVVETHIYVYGFSSPPKKIASYETIANPHGIADLSNSVTLPSSSDTNHRMTEMLAFPGRQVGQIQIVDISPAGQERNLISIVKAHKSKIRAIALNKSGTMVASASETGTIIRVHSVSNCSLLYEFRRGLDKAIIYSIKFSPAGDKLAVLSDKQTLHVFKLQNQELDNRQHLLKNLPIFTNYFNSQWSFVSCRLNNPDANTEKYLEDLNVNNQINDRGLIGWTDEDSIVIIWKFRGKWEKYRLVQADEGWQLVREGWKSFGPLDD